VAKRAEDPVFQNPPVEQWSIVDGQKVPFDVDEAGALQEGGEANRRLTARGMPPTGSSGAARDYLTGGGNLYPQGEELGNRRKTIVGTRIAAEAAEGVLSLGNPIRPDVAGDLTTVRGTPTVFKRHGR